MRDETLAFRLLIAHGTERLLTLDDAGVARLAARLLCIAKVASEEIDPNCEDDDLKDTNGALDDVSVQLKRIASAINSIE